MGESTFDTTLLKKMLNDNTAALAQAERTLASCEADKETEEERIHYLSEQYRSITDWAAEFDVADNDNKKMILARIIEKITVDRSYHLNIIFFVTEESFREEVGKAETDVVNSEAKRQISQIIR